MARCNDNRKARMKRDKKYLKRLAEKRLTPLILKAASVNPAYYDAVVGRPKTVLRDGRRCFAYGKMRCGVRANEKHHDLMRQLAAMCGGMTVDLSAMKEE